MPGPKTDENGQIQRQQQANGDLLREWVVKYKRQIALALPKHVTPDRMARMALSALSQTRDMDTCTPASFIGCVLQCSQLGLEPNTPLGHVYLIPRRSKNLPRNTRECTMIIGYQGFMELARRSGLVTSIKGYVVRDGDEFRFSEGLDPELVHVPSDDGDRDSRAITHAYAIARMKDAPPEFEVLSKSQIDARMKRSETAGKSFSPWHTDYEAMAKKSAVRALWKWLPKSAEIAQAEALEVAAETHQPQSTAWDADVSDALAGGGLLSAPVDQDTGKMIGDADPVDFVAYDDPGKRE